MSTNTNAIQRFSPIHLGSDIADSALQKQEGPSKSISLVLQPFFEQLTLSSATAQKESTNTAVDFSSKSLTSAERSPLSTFSASAASSHLPPKMQCRKIPPLSIHDTLISLDESAHGEGALFADDCILEKEEIIKEKVIPNTNIPIYKTKYNKNILQQQATRGCTAAASGMLLMDNGYYPNPYKLRTRNLGTEEIMLSDLQIRDINPFVSHISRLCELRQALLDQGSAIVSVKKALGAHVIVADEVSEDLSKVRLRDPYHGWEITITSSAFLEEWDTKEGIIQARKMRS